MGLQTDKLLKGYDYILPKELIAQKPISPRHSARLLVYNRAGNNIKFDTFLNLPKYLPRSNFHDYDNKSANGSLNKNLPAITFGLKKLARGLPKGAVLIFNRTKVIPARLPLYKQTGGRVEVLYIGKSGGLIKVLANKKLAVGSVETLFHGREKVFPFKVAKSEKPYYFLKPLFSISKLPSVLSKYGLTPLPPYMKNSPLTEKQRREAYQTVFAKTGESVAAPTASLHFTKQLMAKLKKRGVALKFVRLDVSLGTFAPLKEEQIKSKKLHKENYFIDSSTIKFIQNAKKQGRPIIAVGTTAARTLESYAKSKKLSGSTDLFITPGYKFKIIDGLITNFHVPKSSLMMLVAALTGREKLIKLYNEAIGKKFRFFSFGDGMLIV